MTTPIKGLFSVMLKYPSVYQLRIPTARRQTSRLFTRHGEFAPEITKDKFIQYCSLSRGFEPGSSALKSPTLTTEPALLPWKMFIY